MSEDNSLFPRRFVAAHEAEVEALEGKTHHWYFREGLGDSESLVFVRARIVKGAGPSLPHAP